MSSRPGLLAFILSSVVIAVAYGSAFLPAGPPRWAPVLLALGAAGTMTSAMAIGASRPGRSLGVLRLVFVAAFLLVAGGFAAALFLPDETAASRLWLWLPPRAAVLVYGIGLLPVVLLPLAYAFTFDRVTLSEEDLARFREQVAELRRAREAGERPAPVSGADA